jgi:hypothetical protein
MPGGRHQIGIPAGFNSESVAGFLSECLAGFLGIRTDAEILALRVSASPTMRSVIGLGAGSGQCGA